LKHRPLKWPTRKDWKKKKNESFIEAIHLCNDSKNNASLKEGIDPLWCGAVQNSPSFLIWLQSKIIMSSQKRSPCGHHTVTS
jgi:hypothetical protein